LKNASHGADPSALQSLVSAVHDLGTGDPPATETLPSDLVMTTIHAIHIVTIGTIEELGMPKWSWL